MVDALLIPIEILSYSLRPFSMAIRLFANNDGWAYINVHFIVFLSFLFCFWIFFFSFFGLLVVLAVLVLENLIAFIQAYIFFVLLTIYFKDVLHLLSLALCYIFSLAYSFDFD